MPSIVTVNASITLAPAPSTLQKTGAFVSQGGTSLSVGAYKLLTTESDLAQWLTAAAAITSIAYSGTKATVTTTAPVSLPVGRQFLVDISGVLPVGYNGTVLATVSGTSAFTYTIPSAPGAYVSGGVYLPTSATQLNQMNNTFWAQGSIVPVYVLELGAGTAANGVTSLEAFIAANSTPQFFYSYLVPRYWDADPAFLSLVALYEAPSAKTYFFTTTTLQTYGAYTDVMKDVPTLIEAPALGSWASNVATALLAAPVGPVLTDSVAGALPATTYYARLTYLTAFGETPASAESTRAVAANSVLNIASPSAATGATGYNVYVGTSSGTETLQNASPIAIATPWVEPTSGLVAGVAFPATGIGVVTTTTNHGVAVGDWFQLAGFTPTGYNNWYQAIGGTATNVLVFVLLVDLAPESVLGSLVASLASQTAAPTTGASGEFTMAGPFHKALGYDPNSANLMTPFAFSFMFGVTNWTTQGNSAILTALKAANVNIILTGAEGGISDAILEWGVTEDGEDFMWWYSADWIQIQLDLALSNAVINGSNNPLQPLYYSQSGINTIQDVAVGTCKNGIAFGLGNGTAGQSALTGVALAAALEAGQFDGVILVNAVPFIPYLKGSPGDYKLGKYAGLSVVWIPNRGFTQIIVNLNISDLPVG